MKQWLSRLAACAGMVGMLALAGCSGGGGSDPTPAPAPAPTPTAVAPGITSQPVGQAVTAGQPATFTVVASGTDPLSYQWQSGGTNIAGATSASYTVAAASDADNGASLRVVVSNSAGSVTSSAAALTVNPLVLAPSFVVQPQSATAQDGGIATLAASASGTEPFTYVWKRGGTVIADATAAVYVTPPLTLGDSGAVYSVTVSNAAGSVSSGNATVTVTPVAPTITAGPAAAAIAVGQSASFSVSATGSAPLAYQWRRNGAAIAGATAATYTTPAATLADNGAQFSVVVSNTASSSATSAAVGLSVTAVNVAPAIASAPASQVVFEGQSASFSAAASGTAPLSYQWLRNGTAISGATSASYTTPVLALADSGSRYSLRVGNSAGSATSAEAVLTVNAAQSGLIGRGWSGGIGLETDDNNVLDVASAVSDQGVVTVVFRKSNGTRNVIYATRGTPNAAGVAPTWSTPVAIDLLNGTAVSSMTSNSVDWDVAGAPGGDVLVYWYHNAACASTTYNTAGTCRYYYTARYVAARAAWDAPVLVGDAPAAKFRMRINDRGDAVLAGKSWKRTGTSGNTAISALFLRTASESAYRRQSLDAEPISGSFQFGLDAAGNLLIGANYTQNATTDLVAYRGTVAAGVGTPQVLDTRNAAAALSLVGVGLNGQQVILWSQNNGVTGSTYAATSATATGAFNVVDLNSTLGAANANLLGITVSDAGQAIAVDLGGHRRRRWTAAGGWLAEEALPASIPANEYYFSYSFTRGGDMLVVSLGGSLTTNSGVWGSYDAQRNVLVRAFSPATYVLGVAATAGYAATTLAENGTGFIALLNKFDVLPTPPAPAGDGRPAVANLWGAFLK